MHVAQRDEDFVLLNSSCSHYLGWGGLGVIGNLKPQSFKCLNSQ